MGDGIPQFRKAGAGEIDRRLRHGGLQRRVGFGAASRGGAFPRLPGAGGDGRHQRYDVAPCRVAVRSLCAEQHHPRPHGLRVEKRLPDIFPGEVIEVPVDVGELPRLQQQVYREESVRVGQAADPFPECLADDGRRAYQPEGFRGMDGRDDGFCPQHSPVGQLHARDAPPFGVQGDDAAPHQRRPSVLADLGRQCVGDLLRPARKAAGAFDVRVVYHRVVVERRAFAHASVEGVRPREDIAQQRVCDAFADESGRRCPEVFRSPGRQPPRAVHPDADAAADFAQLRAVAAEPRLFVREQFPDVLFEGFVTVHVGVVARSGQRHDVECLVERPQAQRAEDAEIFEITAHDAAGLHAADVVHARVDRMSPPGERLQAASGQGRLFRDADSHPFAGEHGAALQASEAAADDDYVELPLHVTPPFGPPLPAGSVCIPYSTCACPCARRVSPCPVRGRSGPARASR